MMPDAEKPLIERMAEVGIPLDGTKEFPVSALLDLMLDRLHDARIVQLAASGLRLSLIAARDAEERKRIVDELLADIPRLLDPASSEGVRTDARFRLAGLIPVPSTDTIQPENDT